MPAALSLRHPRDADPVGTWNPRAHGLMHGQWAQTGLLDRGSESGHDTGSPSVGVGTGGFPATDRNGMSAAARGDGLPWP